MWVSISISIHRRMKAPSHFAFLAHDLPPSVSHLDLGSEVQCSNMCLCLYLHPSPYEGSVVTCKIFISMVMGQGQFRHPLLFPHHSPEQSGFPALWEIQVPPPSLQVQEGEHPNRPGSQKASPCRRNKTQCHCQWLLSLHLDLGGSVSPHVNHIQRVRFDLMLV